MGKQRCMLMVVAMFVLAAIGLAPGAAAVPLYTAAVVRTYPHDPKAFTEGLFYRDGFLYESTGLAGQSSVRKVDLQTGKVLRQVDLDSRYFGEGIVAWKDKLIELTWKSQIGFVYDLESFKLLSQFHYLGEGWALTQDGHDLIMSDGTNDLRLLVPDDMREIGRIHVTCDGQPVRYLNELEWVKGQIYANIWLTTLIARIEPASGEVVGLIDLADLVPAAAKAVPNDVLNGIAYDAAGDRLFVTGKGWPVLYQISLSQRPGNFMACTSLH